MKKENMTSISVALIIAVALFAGGGYLEGGFTVAFTRASMIGGLIMFAVAIYFAGLKFLHNHIDTFLVTTVMLFREPKIAEKSVQEIEILAKALRTSMETIRKVLH